MKLKIRRSCQDDLENIYQLHTKCFNVSDQWYKSNIKHYLSNGIVIEHDNSTTKKIIGVLLQGSITPCNKKFTEDNNNDDSNKEQNTIHQVNSGYKEDIFEPVSPNGELFYKDNLHYKEFYGIVMICVDPDFRSKGLAKKLIQKHIEDNPGKMLCLNTRRTNVNAYFLYKKMGYEHIAYIKNKYFQPTEDSVFMVLNLA